jgi:hypothetical protein
MSSSKEVCSAAIYTIFRSGATLCNNVSNGAVVQGVDAVQHDMREGLGMRSDLHRGSRLQLRMLRSFVGAGENGKLAYAVAILPF